MTDPQFSSRLKDLLVHNQFDLENIELLKLGRHFRLSSKAKLVVGRNQQENEKIISLAGHEDFICMPTEELAGPTALGRGVFDAELISLSCGIVAHYCDLSGNKTAELILKKLSGQEEVALEATPLTQERASALRI